MFLVMPEKLFVKCLADVFLSTTILNLTRAILIRGQKANRCSLFIVT